MRSERGSATVTACFVILALIGIVVAVGHVGSVVVSRHRAQSAADLAALAAAAAAVRGVDAACAAADETTARGRATVRECRLDGWDAVVTVVVPVGLGAGEAVAAARAGPAD
jgi:secretion/DNA translocation related TadE-like protein